MAEITPEVTIDDLIATIRSLSRKVDLLEQRVARLEMPNPIQPFRYQPVPRHDPPIVRVERTITDGMLARYRRMYNRDAPSGATWHEIYAAINPDKPRPKYVRDITK